MKGYLINLYTKERLEFRDGTGRIVELEAFTETKEANYYSEETIGRSEPYLLYMNSSSKNIAFSLSFWFDVVEKAREMKLKLESLVYPANNNGLPLPPPPILFVWGNYIKVRGVVRSFSATPNRKWNLHKGLPYGIDVNLMITEVNEEPLYHQDIWRVKKREKK